MRPVVHQGEAVEIDELVVRVRLRVAVGADEGDRLGRRQRRAQRILHDVGDLRAGHRLGADHGPGALAKSGVAGKRRQRFEVGECVRLEERAVVSDLEHHPGRRRGPRRRRRRAVGLARRTRRRCAGQHDADRQKDSDHHHGDPVSAILHGFLLLTRW